MPQLTQTTPEVWLKMGNTSVWPQKICWWTHPVALWALPWDLGIMVSPGNSNLVVNQTQNSVWCSLHCTGCSPSWEELGSAWSNRRSEWGRRTVSDNDKQLLTFLYRILSLTERFHTESGIHPTRLWHSWSASWKLDLMHCWITTLCNFSACNVFSRWEAGLSQLLATSKIKTTSDHSDYNKNLEKALALLCLSKPD